MNCECYGTIQDPERAKYWKEIFPENHVPLVHPLREGRAKTGDEEYDFYKIDLKRISEEQLKEIIKRACAKFNISEEIALESTRTLGIPLRADGVSVQWCQDHSKALVMNAIDFDTAEYEDLEQDDWEDAPDYS